MRTVQWDVHADIRQAWTLPAQGYTDVDVYEVARTHLFTRTWQFVADTDCVPQPEQVHPCTLLAGCLDEPLLLSRDADHQLHCLANVCTHRGHLVCQQGATHPPCAAAITGGASALTGRSSTCPRLRASSASRPRRITCPRSPWAAGASGSLPRSPLPSPLRP